jgi:hypothetical protein
MVRGPRLSQLRSSQLTKRKREAKMGYDPQFDSPDDRQANALREGKKYFDEFIITASASFIPKDLPPNIRQLIKSSGQHYSRNDVKKMVKGIFGFDLSPIENIYLLEFLGAVSAAKMYRHSLSMINQTMNKYREEYIILHTELLDIIFDLGLDDFESLGRYLEKTCRFVDCPELEYYLKLNTFRNLEVSLIKLAAVKSEARNGTCMAIGVVSLQKVALPTASEIESLVELWFELRTKSQLPLLN